MADEQAVSGAEMIAAERRRQVEQGKDALDDEFSEAQLADAAKAYVDVAAEQVVGDDAGDPPPWWPFESTLWKPSHDPVRNLVKAGALLAAEIDRLQRLKAKSGG